MQRSWYALARDMLPSCGLSFAYSPLMSKISCPTFFVSLVVSKILWAISFTTLLFPSLVLPNIAVRDAKKSEVDIFTATSGRGLFGRGRRHSVKRKLPMMNLFV